MPRETPLDVLAPSSPASLIGSSALDRALVADMDMTVNELAAASEQANAALMQGDVARYRTLTCVADDFTLMSPFGGTPSHASSLTEERWEAIGRFFRNGSFRQDLVATYASRDMIVLALVEHTTVEVGELPAQNWSLRVTLIFRRDGSKWHLVHRHADPLAAGISIEHAAALGRGQPL